MEPYHRRLAEIYFKYQDLGWCNISGTDVIHFWECLHAHAIWARKLSYWEALEQAAGEGEGKHKRQPDRQWLNEIGHKKDLLLLNTTGGID